MSRKQEERTIGDYNVTTVQLPATRGSRLRVRVLKLIAPALGQLRGKKIDDLKAIDIADFAPALQEIMGQLDDQTQDALMLEVLVCTSVIAQGPSGQIKYDLTSKPIIDQAFDGDVDALWGAMKFALEVNLRGFFNASVGKSQPIPTPSS